MNYVVAGLTSENNEHVRGTKYHLISCDVHPERDEETYGTDIAIITLTTPIQFSQRVRPICIGGLEHSLQPNEEVN